MCVSNLVSYFYPNLMMVPTSHYARGHGERHDRRVHSKLSYLRYGESAQTIMILQREMILSTLQYLHEQIIEPLDETRGCHLFVRYVPCLQ